MLISLTLLTILALVMFGGGQYREFYPRVRQHWLLLGCGVLVALALPNMWLQAALLWFLLRAWFDYNLPKWLTLVSHTAAAFGAVAAGAHVLTPTDVPVLLWGIASMSVPLAAWAIYSYTLQNCPVPASGPQSWYSHTRWGVTVFEDQRPVIVAGQGNVNHTEAVGGVLAACAVGLALDHPWAWLLVLCALLPIALNWWIRGLSQGVLYVAALASGLTIWLGGWPAVVLSVATFLALAGAFHEHGRYRYETWWMMLTTYWWPRGWGVRLGGHGLRTYSWHNYQHLRQWPDRFMEVWTYAHNEYVQVLYEYGAIGVGLMLAAIGSLTYHLTHPSLIFMAGVLVIAAVVQNPWTFYHEGVFHEQVKSGVFNPDGTERMQVLQRTTTHGSHALNILVGLWLMLAMIGG